MHFGDNLRKIRKLKKLSQEELAEKMNVSRQSISKWETSESYPEMNHILKLCRIFHCCITDLVNDNIVDIDLFDEDTKIKVVKLKKEQQSKVKGLSKAISLCAKIGRIIVMICIPIILFIMILIGGIIYDTDVIGDEIRFGRTKDRIVVVHEEDEVFIKFNDKKVSDTATFNIVLKIKEAFEHHSRIAIIGYVEVGFIFLIINLVLACITLKSLEKLFLNIYRGDTPFTLENIDYIKKMAYLMIAMIVLPNIIGILFEIVLQTKLNIGFELFSLLEVLFLFSMAYIFQYGYEIQIDSNGIMYGEIKE